MGCASSTDKVVKPSSLDHLHGVSTNRGNPDSYPPLLLLEELDHLVALSSINNHNNASPISQAEGKDEGFEANKHQHVRSPNMKKNPHDVLNQLDHMSNHSEAQGPQSWREVSDILQNLKPNQIIHRDKNAPSDAIDIYEVMRGLDDGEDDDGKEGKGQLKVKRSARRGHGTKPFDKSMAIHTLEELDAAGSSQPGREKHVETKKIVDNRYVRKGSSVEQKISSTYKKGVSGTGSHGSADLVSKVPMARMNNVNYNEFNVEFLGSYYSKTRADHLMKEVSNSISSVNRSAHDAQGARLKKEAEDVVDSENMKHNTLGNSWTKQAPFKSDLLQDQSNNEEGSLESVALQRPSTITSGLEDQVDFVHICPPGGEEKIVLYTTSMKGIKKTYEDCIKVRGIVESYVAGSAVVMEERDVSLHLQYMNELRELLQKVVTVPRLFVKGRYIGGADEILSLLKQGKLEALLVQG